MKQEAVEDTTIVHARNDNTGEVADRRGKNCRLECFAMEDIRDKMSSKGI